MIKNDIDPVLAKRLPKAHYNVSAHYLIRIDFDAKGIDAG